MTGDRQVDIQSVNLLHLETGKWWLCECLNRGRKAAMHRVRSDLRGTSRFVVAVRPCELQNLRRCKSESKASCFDRSAS